MENASSSDTYFYASLDSALLDCRPRAPNREVFCPISTAYGIVTGLLLPLVTASGLFGNCVTAWVTLGRGAERSRINVYLGAMAIADSAYLLVGGFLGLFLVRGLPWISGGRFGFIVYNVSAAMCTAYRFFQHWLSLQSMGIFLAMVLDRALCLAMPFRFQVLTQRTAWRVCGSVVAGSIALSSVCLAVYGWQVLNFSPNGPRLIACMVYSSITGSPRVLLGMHMILLLYPPTLLIFCVLATNCYLACKLVSILRLRRQLTSSTNLADERDKMTNTIVCVAMSVLLTVCSMPCALTILAAQIVGNGEYKTEADAQLLRALLNISQVGQALILFNQSGNWLLLLWTSPNYRQRFMTLFCLRCRGREQPSGTEPLPVRELANLPAARL